ncbi:MAG: four helix bundle protein [Dissulfuribacterales bacterium]
MLRSGTSPYPNHGEAQSAESPKDFVHKLRISLKEFRETQRWLKLIQNVPLIFGSSLKLRSKANSLFDVQRWTFDVGCWMFNLFDIYLSNDCIDEKLKFPRLVNRV